MNIKSLPPECLLIIFNYIDQLDDLRNCSLVCVEWESLVLDRCSKIEYLLETSCIDSLEKVVYIGRYPKLEQLDLSKMFPMLRIFDASFTGLNQWRHSSSNFESIKGLINHSLNENQSRAPHLPNLEMVSTEFMDFFFKHQLITQRLKQISIQNVNLIKMKGITCDMKKLRRLHIVDKNANQKLYKGSKLLKLKILEFDFDSMAGVLVYPGFCFIDFCPVLESAFFHCSSTYCQFNFTIKNPYLTDLVIEYQNDYQLTYSPFFRSGGHAQKWETLRLILGKFPNLKHLAIRNNLKLIDEDVEDLLKLLPNLVLLDIRGSTEISFKSVFYMNQHCKRNKKQITFYLDVDIDFQRDWPQISFDGPDICHGFNFMKNCFFKSFHSLPLLLDSMEKY